MSPATLEAEFRALLIAQFPQHEEVVSDAISKILRTEIPDEVKVLMFETQSDWSTIPIVAFAMDDTAPVTNRITMNRSRVSCWMVVARKWSRMVQSTRTDMKTLASTLMT